MPPTRAAASATNPTPIAAERELTTRTAEPNSRAACTAELIRAGQGRRKVHRDHAVTVAVAQRLTVGLGELRGRGAGGGDTRPIVDVVRHVVNAVTQIGAVDKHVQRHLPDVELLELI